MRLAYLTLFLSFNTLALDTTSSQQDKQPSVIRSLSSNSNADISASSNFDACNVHFKDYVYPALSDDEYYKKKSPISEWYCLYSGEAFEAGYDTQHTNDNGIDESSTDNKIIYDYKSKDWKSVPDDNYTKKGKANHLELIKIKSKNSSGFMAINSMEKLKDGSNVEGFYFCLIHNNNALCGSGESVKSSGEFISSQDALKLLNSISFDKNQ
ncbi:MAG: hypothetical protein LKK36_16890 [Ewingella americana]|jgi:hypothetical protein|uniref:hypothetical protein n=1 Tax=Ewingella americana TaxID=41202 RepID=UPI002432F6B2|nr:hypothetical protein [Ewingella americana]MCI1679232.1 hypothetical protein [Ewingella americana]MCI1852124.1 hypothetical protein [Ewingella americana]MCI1862526.1 hypothetical protein [Ewingella americana]MCI2142692.1 hypothetical protein [Ewingella americana]MCI2165353.1 hypothetical protein [Ewingella americana]